MGEPGRGLSLRANALVDGQTAATALDLPVDQAETNAKREPEHRSKDAYHKPISNLAANTIEKGTHQESRTSSQASALQPANTPSLDGSAEAET